MEIVDTVKFAIGLALFGAGLGVLWWSRNQRGFGQRRQAGALLIVVGAAFAAMGFGVDFRAMLGR